MTTLARRIPLVLLAIIAGYLLIGLAYQIGYVSTAVADVPTNDMLIADAGSGSGSAAAPAPADKLHNPVDDPLAAISDVRAAKKVGWAAAILASLVMLTAGLARAAQRWPTVRALMWFSKHKNAIFVVSGVGTVAAAAYNALVLGGTMMAAAFAAGGAVLTLIPPHPKSGGAS